MVSDILVMVQFYQEEQFDTFRKSLSFFCAALLCHVMLSLVKNSRKPMRAKVVCVMQALFVLRPAIKSYDHWKGKPMDDDDVMPPVVILIMGRARVLSSSYVSPCSRHPLPLFTPPPLLFSPPSPFVHTAFVVQLHRRGRRHHDGHLRQLLVRAGRHEQVGERAAQ